MTKLILLQAQIILNQPMDHVQDLVTLENSGKIHGQIHSHIILENHQNPMALNASKLRRVRYAEEPSR